MLPNKYECPVHMFIEDESDILKAHGVEGSCILCAMKDHPEYQGKLVPVRLKEENDI